MTQDQVKVETPPNSKESEMMVLGCMLTSINGLNIASEELDDSDFYYTEHKIIFQVLKSAYKNDKPADVHLVCEELKRLEKLKNAGGAGYITTLAQYAGAGAYIEEYTEIVKSKSILRAMISASQEALKDALDEPDNPALLLEKSQNNLKILEQRQGKKIPIIDPIEHLENQKRFLALYRGKDIIGLRTSKIPEFNKNLLGLRGLILLAAAPNVGKTAFTIQLGIDVLENEKEACLIYISLEMSSLTIFNRMTFHLAEMDFNTFVLGSQGVNAEISFTETEFRKIQGAEEKLKSFGERLQIIDSKICPCIDSRMIINFVETLKFKTQCKRAIVIIDYLQVWTTPQNMGENEADKWRIGEMKKIRDGIQDDPVIVISEARKPSDPNKGWANDLSDIMGSARGSYTPDVVMFLNTVPDKEIRDLFTKMSIVNLPSENMVDLLAHKGMSICCLKVDKCRDGMKRFKSNLTFHFHKNKFEPIKWLDMNMLLKNEPNKTNQIKRNS